MVRGKHKVAMGCAVCLSLVSSMFAMSKTAHAATDKTVTVHEGDTLWWIARQHHTSVDTLKQMNGLQSDVLQVDQKLRVPNPPPAASTGEQKQRALRRLQPKFRYVVQSGDTLWGISRRFYTTVNGIMELNGLQSTVIYPQEELWIPKTVAALTAQRKVRAVQTVDTSIRSARGIPSQLIPVYVAAGRKYGIPWTVLAAIHREETNFGTTAEVSPDGARGPMQFLPTTFAQYAVKAPGQYGRPNIDNVYDAIYTCAHMLAADGYQSNPAGALYLYNHSMSYVCTVQRLASQYAA